METVATAAPRTFRWRRFAIAAICALLVAGVIAGYAWRASRGSLALDEAEAALRRNDPIAARMHIDRAFAAGPKQERGLLLAARAARRSGDYADAERFLTELDALGEPTEAGQLEWVLLGVQQGDFGSDESRLRSAVGRNHPKEVAILEALARGYMASYRPNAQEALARLLEREPDHVPGLILRAATAERFRQFDAAEEDLRRAVEKSPDNAAAQTALARLLSRRGRTREAIYHFELAQQLQPAGAAIRLGLARAMIDAADLDGAATQLDALLAAEPNHTEGLVERGRLELRRGHFADAEPFLERATRSAPWHRDAHQLYLIVLKELGKSDAAAKCQARLADLDREDAIGGRLKLRARDAPGDEDVRMQLWDWSARNGQLDEGVVWLTEILRANPRHAAAQAAFADYFDRVGQPRRAALHRSAAGK